MTMRIPVRVAIAALLGMAATARAEMGSVGTRESALYADSLARLGIGLKAGMMQRDVVDASGGLAVLDYQSGSFFAGVDLTDWLTLYGTAGVAQLQTDARTETYGDPQFHWTGGLQINLWRYDIIDPEFLAGSIMFKLMGEYADYSLSSDADSRVRADWTETSGAFLISYEMYVETELTRERIPYSLRFSAGPSVSTINGTYVGGGSFGEDNSLGVTGSVDLFIAHNLALGATVQYYDDASMIGSLMYHF